MIKFKLVSILYIITFEKVTQNITFEKVTQNLTLKEEKDLHPSVLPYFFEKYKIEIMNTKKISSI